MWHNINQILKSRQEPTNTTSKVLLLIFTRWNANLFFLFKKKSSLLDVPFPKLYRCRKTDILKKCHLFFSYLYASSICPSRRNDVSTCIHKYLVKSVLYMRPFPSVAIKSSSIFLSPQCLWQSVGVKEAVALIHRYDPLSQLSCYEIMCQSGSSSVHLCCVVFHNKLSSRWSLASDCCINNYSAFTFYYIGRSIRRFIPGLACYTGLITFSCQLKGFWG